jgi:hypothetical protein
MLLSLQQLSNETITLYRGDSTHINKFDVSKTHESCLYGRGIYLTTDFLIAQTYQTKDAEQFDRLWIKPLFSNNAQTKIEAKEQAFIEFARRFVKDNGKLVTTCQEYRVLEDARKTNLMHLAYASKRRDATKIPYALPDKLNRLAKVHWEEIEPSLLIKIEPIGYPPPMFLTASSKVMLKYPSTVKAPQDAKPRYFVISMNHKPVGFVSKFQFPGAELKNNVIDMCSCWNTDPAIAEILLSIMNNKKQKEDKVPSLNLELLCNNEWINPTKFENAFKRWGYYGLYHTGGLTRGAKNHGVFILWDNDFVNAHYVGKVR